MEDIDLEQDQIMQPRGSMLSRTTTRAFYSMISSFTQLWNAIIFVIVGTNVMAAQRRPVSHNNRREVQETLLQEEENSIQLSSARSPVAARSTHFLRRPPSRHAPSLSGTISRSPKRPEESYERLGEEQAGDSRGSEDHLDQQDTNVELEDEGGGKAYNEDVERAVNLLAKVDLDDGSWKLLWKDPIEVYYLLHGEHTAGRAKFPFSPEDILELLLMPPTDPIFAVLLPNAESVENIRRPDESTAVQHLIFEKKVAMQQRDACVVSHHRPLKGGGYIYSRISCDDVPADESRYARTLYEPPNGWILKPLGENETEVTFVGRICLGGSFPRMVVKKINRQVPLKVHRLLKAMNENPPKRRKRKSSSKPVTSTVPLPADPSAQPQPQQPRYETKEEQEAFVAVQKECEMDVESLLGEDLSDPSWKLVQKEPIEIFHKDSSGTPTVQRTMGRTRTKNFTPKQVLDTLKLDMSHEILRRTRPLVEETIRIKDWNDRISINRITYTKVTLVSQRDMCLRVHWAPIPNGYVFTTVSCDDVPPPKKFVRATVMRPSGWIMRSVGEETEVIFIANVCLGGKLPGMVRGFLINDTPMQIHRLLKAMEDVGI